MWYLISFVAFVACVQVLLRVGDWRLAAGVYLAAKVFLAVLLGHSLHSVAVTAVVVGVVSFAYFWLLDRVQDSGWWWPALVGGVILLA